MTAPTQRVPRIADPRSATAWDAPAWAAAAELAIASFHPRSSDHRPRVAVRLGHDGTALHLLFHFDGELVASRELHPNGDVYRDTCLEFFVEPLPGRGYFNLECNAGGTLHCRHIRDPRRVGDGFADAEFLRADELAGIGVATTLPRTVDPERSGRLAWTLALRIPFAVYAARLGAAVGPGQAWRGNLFTCAEAVSRPHWASWSPVGEVLNFHVPERFGTLRLDP